VDNGTRYQKTQEGNVTVFETKPAPCPKYWFMLILGLLMAYAASASGLGGFIGLVIWGLAIAAVVAFFKDPRPKGVRAPAKLRVAEGQLVTTSGLTFRTQDIKGIELSNLYDEGGSGTGIGGKDVGFKRKQKIRAISWLLRLDCANNQPSINIACGLDHDSAANLLREVSNIMDTRQKAQATWT
jgi:hypothetical protein